MSIEREYEYKSEFSKKVKSVCYKHELIVKSDGKEYVSTLLEYLPDDQESKLKTGDILDLLWNESKKTYLNIGKIRKDLRQYSIIFALCAVVLVACMIFAYFLS